MKLLSFLILIVLLNYCQCKKADQSSENEDESSKQKTEINPVIDKLAVNLAGAFVKSIFPEIERSTKPPEVSNPGGSINIADVRRSPGIFDLTSSGQNGLYSSLQNPFPNIGAVPGLSNYASGVAPYRTDLPASYVYPFAQPGQIITLPNGGQPFGLGRESLSSFSTQGLPGIPLQSKISIPENIDAINQYRKEQYLAELQRHQNELDQYTAKQMEYLDQQRKYQQSMLDHQAGAALLMQEQQQNLLNKRMKLMSYGESPEELQVAPEEEFDDGILDQQTGGSVLQNAKNKNPFKQFASRTELEATFPEKNDQEPLATDEYLRNFFKENYDIDINKSMDGEQLTPEERNTLRELKEYLISEAKGDGIKVGALETLRKYKNKSKQVSKPRKDEIQNLFKNNNEEFEKSEACDKCKPLQLQRLFGAWTQIYGNPTALKRIYSTVLSLQSISLKTDLVTTSLTSRKASCVGFQVCLVKAGPEDQGKYEYIILAETDGSDRCRSYHIFARDINQFKKQYYDTIADFMKREVIEMNILPVAGLPRPHYCQLNFRV
uniref:Uncharacterized protein n=1 Tax=Syphacia muris TaxID=451379 RepID=A0A0N5ARU4_9BILA